MPKSTFDDWSDALAPFARDYNDFFIDELGTETSILRIRIDKTNVFGDKDIRYEAKVIGNVIIDFQFNSIEIFNLKVPQALDQATNIDEGFQLDVPTSNTSSIDIMDLLPLEVIFKFKGEYFNEPNLLSHEDLIVHIHYDENNNPIPIILRVGRMKGDFMGKNLVTKKCEVTLHRGDLPTLIQNEIDNYINNGE
jgi:hypothetical protein